MEKVERLEQEYNKLLVASRRIPNLALMVPFCEGRRNGYPLSNNHS